MILGGEFVKKTIEQVQELIRDLYQEYENAFQLRETFSIEKIFAQGKPFQQLRMNGALIESNKKSFVFQSECNIRLSSNVHTGVQVQIPPGQPMPLIPGLPINLNVQTTSIGWKENKQEV